MGLLSFGKQGKGWGSDEALSGEEGRQAVDDADNKRGSRGETSALVDSAQRKKRRIGVRWKPFSSRGGGEVERERPRPSYRWKLNEQC